MLRPQVTSHSLPAFLTTRMYSAATITITTTTTSCNSHCPARSPNLGYILILASSPLSRSSLTRPLSRIQWFLTQQLPKREELGKITTCRQSHAENTIRWRF